MIDREKAERWRAWFLAKLGQHHARTISEAIIDAGEPSRTIEHAAEDSDLEMTRIVTTKFSTEESRGVVF